MDMSLVEVDDKQVNVNEVPEYAAEIHSYLREMEVRDSPSPFFPSCHLCYNNRVFVSGENQTEGRLHEEAA